MRVTVVGMGRVGLTTAVALEYLGHEVAAVDRDEGLIEGLRKGTLPFHETGLEPLWRSSRIELATSLEPAHLSADFILIAVGTPGLPEGGADVSAVEAVADDVGRLASDGQDFAVVVKSTVPPGTCERVGAIIDAALHRRGCSARAAVASNPEFLREGSALFDTLYPDRIVIGAEDAETAKRLRTLYAPMIDQRFTPPEDAPRPEGYASAPVLEAKPVDAELIKYAANAFLATKLSFVNELAALAEAVGADIETVTAGLGYDPRIGPHYMKAGPGWGGPCLGKDARAFLSTAAQNRSEMSVVAAALEANARQRRRLVERLENTLGSYHGTTIGILGLAFKANTDDLADSPALEVASLLLERGARVRCFDPVSERRAQREHPELALEYHESVEELAKDCDALIVMTDWAQFRDLPWRRLARTMRGATVLDGRNILDRQLVEQAGLTYLGVGR
ncbi:MAG: UDP-glucose/GDP-mannose dehydrogenase family protein [Chloroflexi bacterium]|nr:UDP-glucose/GDP-mannose dehydrogenase family protein [Chloroflexota bacterium]